MDGAPRFSSLREVFSYVGVRSFEVSHVWRDDHPTDEDLFAGAPELRHGWGTQVMNALVGLKAFASFCRILLLAGAFGDGDDAVDAGDSDLLEFAIGPVNFEAVDGGGLAESEVEARVAR